MTPEPPRPARGLAAPRLDAGIAGDLYDYIARRYDPVLGRFIQPDTIVPDPGDPQSLNRYAYVLNNPIRFIDPSGYDPLDAAWREEFYSVHGREPTAEDMLIRLFSIAFPDEWNWSAFYSENGEIKSGAIRDIFHTIPQNRNWANMPEATKRLAAWYNQDETEAFIRDIGFLFAGLPHRFEEENGWAAVRTGRVQGRPSVWIGGDGLARDYRGSDLTGNVHHWTWSLNLGYFRGAVIGRVINEAREFQSVNRDINRFRTNPNTRADVALGNIGVRMGDYMNGLIFGPRPPQSLQNAWNMLPLQVNVR